MHTEYRQRSFFFSPRELSGCARHLRAQAPRRIGRLLQSSSCNAIRHHRGGDGYLPGDSLPESGEKSLGSEAKRGFLAARTPFGLLPTRAPQATRKNRALEPREGQALRAWLG